MMKIRTELISINAKKICGELKIYSKKSKDF